MNKKIYLMLCVSILLFSCQSGEKKQENADYQYKGDTLCITDDSNLNSKIKLQTVKKEIYSPEFNTTGVVKPIAGQIAEIAPPFDGRITKSFVRLGQKVSAGTALFELSSGDFYEATKNYFQSLQTKKVTELNLQRQKDLVKNGVGSVKEQEEAEANYEIALKDYENAVSALKIFNVDPNQLAMGQALKVVSPIAGEVVQNNIVIGQYVKSDAEPLAVVAELSKVWVVAQVKEKYIGSIQPEDKVEIRTDADAEHIISGRVFHISELLDEETRAVQVLIVCDNWERKLKPGMFTEVHFISASKESILVPSTAILQTESDSYVFVEAGKGKFLKRPVKISTAKGNQSLVMSGLQPGDIIVSEGAIYLPMN